LSERRVRRVTGSLSISGGWIRNPGPGVDLQPSWRVFSLRQWGGGPCRGPGARNHGLAALGTGRGILGIVPGKKRASFGKGYVSRLPESAVLRQHVRGLDRGHKQPAEPGATFPPSRANALPGRPKMSSAAGSERNEEYGESRKNPCSVADPYRPGDVPGGALPRKLVLFRYQHVGRPAGIAEHSVRTQGRGAVDSDV